MRINNNISALNAWRNLYANDTALTKSMEKLSSGFRINRAADDAAGLAISEKMRAQISGLNMAIKNAQDGISLIQTAEGALNETHTILRRMRDLAVQSANDTNTDADRAHLQKEVSALVAELDRIANDTEFNTKKLLNGDLAEADDGAGGTTPGAVLHIGANSGQTIEISIGDMTASALGVVDTDGTVTNAVESIDISDQDGANSALDVIDAAIDMVSGQRADLGAIQNRLEHTINNLQVTAENLAASESRIRDVDVALETTTFVKNQILVQAATAMLAQSNAKPQSVLQLLG